MTSPNGVSTYARDQLRSALEAVGGFVRMCVLTGKALFKPPFQWREFIQQSWFLMRVAFLPTLAVSIPLTVLLIFTLNILLAEFGAADVSGAGAAIGAVTQLGPLVTVLVVAGAGSTAICADLGARTIREEIDALEVLGIDPIHRLVVPRVVASTFVAVLLNGAVITIGLVGGFVFGVYLQNVSAGAYLSTLTLITGLPEVVISIVKAGTFGLIAGQPRLETVSGLTNHWTQKYLPFATVVIGVLLVALAIWLLAGKDIGIMLPKLSSSAPTARLRSMYGYGVGYAVASLSCTVAPFLAVISTTFKQGSILTGILAFIAYAAGMAITVGVAALAVALAGSSAATAIRRILPHVGRIAGVIVLLTALYVTYYGYYEIRLFFTDAGPNDPIIEAAATVQGWLARQVDTLGAWPLLAVLAALAAAAVGWRMRTRRGDRTRCGAEDRGDLEAARRRRLRTFGPGW